MSNLKKVFLTLSTIIVAVGCCSIAFGILSTYTGGNVTASSSFIRINEYGQYWFDVGAYFQNIRLALVNFIEMFVKQTTDMVEGVATTFSTSNIANYIIMVVNFLIYIINVFTYPFRLIVLLLSLFLSIIGWDLTSANWFVQVLDAVGTEPIPFLVYLP